VGGQSHPPAASLGLKFGNGTVVTITLGKTPTFSCLVGHET